MGFGKFYSNSALNGSFVNSLGLTFSGGALPRFTPVSACLVISKT